MGRYRPLPAGVIGLVDLDDVDDEGTIFALTRDIPSPYRKLGVVLTVGDYDGNRAMATVVAVGGGLVRLALEQTQAA